MVGQNLFARGGSVVLQFVLASLLVPADFGLISLAFIAVTMVSILLTSGIEDVVLQRGKALRFWTGTVTWSTFLLGAAAFLILALIAYPLAHFYGEPSLGGLIVIAALQLPLAALASSPTLILRARLDFVLLSMLGLAETVFLVVLSIVLAAKGFGAYALVIPLPIFAGIRTAILWLVTYRDLHWHPRLNRAPALLKNTRLLYLNRVVTALYDQGDYFILGLFVGPQPLGYYYFAFRVSAQPIWVLAANLGSILFPSFVMMQKERDRQREASVAAARLLAFSVIPVGFLQAAMAGPLIDMLASKWQPSVLLIQILSVGLAMTASAWVFTALLTARGEFVLLLRFSAWLFPVFVILAVFGAYWGGPVGVALAVAIFHVATKPLFVTVALGRIGVHEGPRLILDLFVSPAALSAIAALVTAGTLAGGSAVTPGGLAPLAQLCFGSLAFVVSYALLVRFVFPQVWNEFARRLHLSRG